MDCSCGIKLWCINNSPFIMTNIKFYTSKGELIAEITFPYHREFTFKEMSLYRNRYPNAVRILVDYAI